MDEFEEALEEVESGYLQLLRFSDEIESELSKKQMLIQDSYRKYSAESIQIKEKWKASIDKDNHLYQKKEMGEETSQRIEDVKKKIMRNIQAIEVRLRHLDPLSQYINKVKINIEKFKHYSSKGESEEELKRVKKNLELLFETEIEGKGVLEMKEQIKKILG